ncbi:transporter substrate-binding domain-containing protein [Pseudorhodoplanes sinuspersici]|uniref:ABC transporter substrate-binding protein n=1 Tax=Pseudorhodoplanes sinuspersici TaxID=1235591 RepID=A0A1W7A1C8_9HYPH|nr:transporter substrate-binding domain-containing protein [Pseudorhodoplanes sinuspersici]ARQ03241.1 ABC transporter substrate-binding protein [Pseudorhodoplanes sinuspersici]RKE74361.1 amino acid ABC transporter substrate-binding protein (PAAT family) [Pseudorhodoplanes sinuspersici]
MKRLPFLFVLAFFVTGGRADAQPTPQNIPTPQIVKVGVYVSPPFVLKNDDGYSGMAVELWQKATADLSVVSEYQEFPNTADLMGAVADGRVHAAVTNLTITKARAQTVDFTQPWFDSGLRVMVHSDARGSMMALWEGLREAGHLANFAWIAAIMLVATALMTIFDRKLDAEFPKRWREGLAENLYHVISLATTGEASRKNLFGWVGRIGEAMWLLCSVAVIAYVASSITSVMTASHISNQIKSVADLQGRIVGVRAGSVAEDYLQTFKLRRRPFNHINEAAEALVKREIAAVVDDSSILEYFTHTHPHLPLDVVGNTFRSEKYGFAFTAGSALTKPVSLRIIGLQENGEVEKLKARYFGFKP